MMNTKVARTRPFSTPGSGENKKQDAKSKSNENPSQLAAHATQRRFWLAGRNLVRAVAIRERPFVAFTPLRIAARTKPAIAAFRRKTFSSVAAASAIVGTERAWMSLIRVPANPILIRTRVAIFFEAELIEQSPHASEFCGVHDGQGSVNKREQDKAVGKRNVHEEPKLKQALRGILKVNILRGFNPIAHFGGNRFFGIVQVAIQRV